MLVNIDIDLKDDKLFKLLEHYLQKQAEIFVSMFLNNIDDVEIEELENQDVLLNSKQEKNIKDLMSKIN